MRFIFSVLCLQLAWANAMAEAEPEIVINGLEERQENNVRAYLSLGKESCATPQWKIDSLAEKSPEQVRQALKALGYYQPLIRYKLNRLDDCWRLVLDIQAGEPVRLDEIDIRISGDGGKEDFFISLLQHLPVKRGDILDHSVYEEIKSQLVTLAEANGYFDYYFDKSVLLVNPDLKQAGISIHFVTGHRYYFGEITIDQDILDPEFVAQYLNLAQNQPYNRDRIINTHQAFDGSGYFRQVQIKYREKDAVNYHAPLSIMLQPLPRYVISLGLGYDTDLGVRGNAEYKNRYVNRAGHRFSADVNASQKKPYLLLDYQIPFAGKRKRTLTFRGGFVYENTQNIESETISLGVRYSSQFKKKQLLTQQLDLVAERFDSGGGEKKFKIMLVPGVSWSNIITGGKGYELQGYKYSYQLQGGHRYFLSDVSFIRQLFKFKVAFKLDWGGRIIARTDLGATAVDDFIELPTSYRFYTGGNSSVRGYQYKSIGASDDHGNVIGGKFLTVASLEYEQLILDKWSLAVFADAGDAFNDRWDIKFGIGWGIRWYSLIGPIRADMAFPSGDMSDFRFHFSFSSAL